MNIHGNVSRVPLVYIYIYLYRVDRNEIIGIKRSLPDTHARTNLLFAESIMEALLLVGGYATYILKAFPECCKISKHKCGIGIYQ